MIIDTLRFAWIHLIHHAKVFIAQSHSLSALCTVTTAPLQHVTMLENSASVDNSGELSPAWSQKTEIEHCKVLLTLTRSPHLDTGRRVVTPVARSLSICHSCTCATSLCHSVKSGLKVGIQLVQGYPLILNLSPAARPGLQP